MLAQHLPVIRKHGRSRRFLAFCSTVDTSLLIQAEQKSVAELQALLARTIEGVSFFLLLIDHRIGELIGQWVYPLFTISTLLMNLPERMTLLRNLSTL